MSSARRPPERPPGRSPQPSRATNGGGNGRVHVTNRGWAALVGLVVVVALLAGWAMFRGGSGKPGAQGTTAATGGISTTSPSTTPASSDTTDPSPGVEALPACAYSVLPAPDAKLGQWRQTLLDTTFALPENYTPPDLVSICALPVSYMWSTYRASVGPSGVPLLAVAGGSTTRLFLTPGSS